MHKSKSSEFQAIKILMEICREQGISSATYYKWNKYGSMEASDVRRMRSLLMLGVSVTLLCGSI
jgi:hypothetical protein